MDSTGPSLAGPSTAALPVSDDLCKSFFTSDGGIKWELFQLTDIYHDTHFDKSNPLFIKCIDILGFDAPTSWKELEFNYNNDIGTKCFSHPKPKTQTYMGQTGLVNSKDPQHKWYRMRNLLEFKIVNKFFIDAGHSSGGEPIKGKVVLSYSGNAIKDSDNHDTEFIESYLDYAIQKDQDTALKAFKATTAHISDPASNVIKLNQVIDRSTDSTETITEILYKNHSHTTETGFLGFPHGITFKSKIEPSSRYMEDGTKIPPGCYIYVLYRNHVSNYNFCAFYRINMDDEEKFISTDGRVEYHRVSQVIGEAIFGPLEATFFYGDGNKIILSNEVKRVFFNENKGAVDDITIKMGIEFLVLKALGDRNQSSLLKQIIESTSTKYDDYNKCNCIILTNDSYLFDACKLTKADDGVIQCIYMNSTGEDNKDKTIPRIKEVKYILNEDAAISCTIYEKLIKKLLSEEQMLAATVATTTGTPMQLKINIQNNRLIVTNNSLKYLNRECSEFLEASRTKVIIHFTSTPDTSSNVSAAVGFHNVVEKTKAALTTLTATLTDAALTTALEAVKKHLIDLQKEAADALAASAAAPSRAAGQALNKEPIITLHTGIQNVIDILKLKEGERTSERRAHVEKSNDTKARLEKSITVLSEKLVNAELLIINELYKPFCINLKKFFTKLIDKHNNLHSEVKRNIINQCITTETGDNIGNNIIHRLTSQEIGDENKLKLLQSFCNYIDAFKSLKIEKNLSQFFTSHPSNIFNYIIDWLNSSGIDIKKFFNSELADNVVEPFVENYLKDLKKKPPIVADLEKNTIFMLDQLEKLYEKKFFEKSGFIEFLKNNISSVINTLFDPSPTEDETSVATDPLAIATTAVDYLDATAAAAPGATPPADPTAAAAPGATPTADPTAAAAPGATPPADPTATAAPGATPPAEPTATAAPGATPPADPTVQSLPAAPSLESGGTLDGGALPISGIMVGGAPQVIEEEDLKKFIEQQRFYELVSKTKLNTIINNEICIFLNNTPTKIKRSESAIKKEARRMIHITESLLRVGALNIKIKHLKEKLTRIDNPDLFKKFEEVNALVNSARKMVDIVVQTPNFLASSSKKKSRIRMPLKSKKKKSKPQTMDTSNTRRRERITRMRGLDNRVIEIVPKAIATDENKHKFQRGKNVERYKSPTAPASQLTAPEAAGIIKRRKKNKKIQTLKKKLNKKIKKMKESFKKQVKKIKLNLRKHNKTPKKNKLLTTIKRRKNKKDKK